MIVDWTNDAVVDARAYPFPALYLGAVAPVVPTAPTGGSGLVDLAEGVHTSYRTTVNLLLVVSPAIGGPETPGDIGELGVALSTPDVVTRVTEWPTLRETRHQGIDVDVTFSLRSESVTTVASPGKVEDDEALMLGLFDDEF